MGTTIAMGTVLFPQKMDSGRKDPVRVNGNVYLMNEFYRLFNIKSGKLYLVPTDRIEIW